MLVREFNLLIDNRGVPPPMIIVVSGHRADGRINEQLIPEYARKLKAAVCLHTDGEEIVIVIAKVLMGQVIKLLGNEQGTDDEQGRQRELQDDQALGQIVSAGQAKALVQGVYRVEAGEDQRRIEARGKAGQ